MYIRRHSTWLDTERLNYQLHESRMPTLFTGLKLGQDTDGVKCIQARLGKHHSKLGESAFSMAVSGIIRRKYESGSTQSTSIQNVSLDSTT